jgi:hypothetical protein
MTSGSLMFTMYTVTLPSVTVHPMMKRRRATKYAPSPRSIRNVVRIAQYKHDPTPVAPPDHFRHPLNIEPLEAVP